MESPCILRAKARLLTPPKTTVNSSPLTGRTLSTHFTARTHEIMCILVGETGFIQSGFLEIVFEVCKTARSQLLACYRNPKSRATSLLGSSAFSSQTRSFPSLPYGRFGFILYCKVVTLITSQLYLNVNRYIFLFLHNYSQV